MIARSKKSMIKVVIGIFVIVQAVTGYFTYTRTPYASHEQLIVEMLVLP